MLNCVYQAIKVMYARIHICILKRFLHRKIYCDLIVFNFFFFFSDSSPLKLVQAAPQAGIFALVFYRISKHRRRFDLDEMDKIPKAP